MSKIFFTSDNHWNHANIHKFCPQTRPDADVDVMDRKMISQWNYQVSPEDTVWMLGDVFFCKADKAKRIMNQLNGIKHLILGNHDRIIESDKSIQDMFASIHKYKEIVISRTTLCLFHYPIAEHNKCHYGSYHLHGHIHNRVSGVNGRILNVCVDSSEMAEIGRPYKLYSWEEVDRVLSKRNMLKHHGKDKEDIIAEHDTERYNNHPSQKAVK